ncbi:MAG: pilus assembly protein [Bradyrhizobium sp.]|uniref:TadE/TadG family type IV pilus assembly protein n=1 Tax=Bradyrhizobium sp. TaxID=376 RepID=UPI0011F798E7|nr:TadE/TadG family type IV pilus assembly protein [Bradyrhizobium sp.]THD63796.1 MAG: pilus assembly protein [Bradyrhizobium sp.]
MKSISRIWRGMRLSAAELFRDQNGIAATEFAMIVPIMLVMFFGTVEFSSGVAVDRKVTLVARTLSDLASQSTSVASSDLTNFFAASTAILTPYSSTPTNAAISELYVNPTTLRATVQWSQAYQGGTARAVGTTVTIPSALAIAGTYLIFSEVSYLYTPAVGYVMAKAGVTLSDVAYTRPRQSTCVYYSPATACTTN